MSTATTTTGTLTERQERIWSHLCLRHRGRGKGVTHAALSDLLGIPQRRVREALAALVIKHGYPIGSHPRHGVYVCMDVQDYELARQCLADEMWPTKERDRALEALQREHLREQERLVVQGGLFDLVDA